MWYMCLVYVLLDLHDMSREYQTEKPNQDKQKDMQINVYCNLLTISIMWQTMVISYNKQYNKQECLEIDCNWYN